MKILIVDDEKEALVSFKRILKRDGFSDVETCDNGEKAVEQIKKNSYDIVLLDLMLPGRNGLQILEATKPYKLDTEFIMITAVDDLQTAVDAIKLGAYDYLVKPVEPERLNLVINRAYERKGLISSLQLKSSDDTKKINSAFGSIITQCTKLKDLLLYAEIMAKSGNPIMITGESGTGKELFARGIHKLWSPNGPFVAVNVASVPEALFESQFFGHTAGAFTGANKAHVGYFKQANNGTIFLDEIGELPLNQQAKLLRVLEEKIIYPLGETRAIPVNVRIVSATNVDIATACKEGKFRLDLLYRLKSAQIHLLPLHLRNGDIPLLAKHFLEKFSKKYNKRDLRITPEVIEILSKRKYPGNIREFAQIIENAVILSEKNMILPKNIGAEVISDSVVEEYNLSTLKENSDAHVVRVLTHTNGDKNAAAKILGISLRQVQRKISQIKNNSKLYEMIKDL